MVHKHSAWLLPYGPVVMAEMNQDEIQKKMGLLFLAIKQAQHEGSARQWCTPWGRCDHRSRAARCSAQTAARGLWLGYIAE